MEPEVAASESAPTVAVSVRNETGRLRRVVIGNPETFVLPEPINPKMLVYDADHPEAPTRESLAPQYQDLRAALEERGVEVLQPKPVDGVPDQLTPRDIGVVIGSTLVVCAMRPESRREEWRGIESIIDAIDDEHVLRVPAGSFVEGGDVVVDRGFVFVGMSDRSTPAGAAVLRERFGDEFEVISVPLKSDDDGEDVLHLDCAFVPVGERHALIYPDGFRAIPDAIRDEYEWIEVDREEQHHLFTNVLSVDANTVFSRRSAVRVNQALRDAGLDVVEIAFSETTKVGGSFRCASLPLVRE